MITRRSFAANSAKIMLGFTALASVPLTGCSAITDLENWIPIALTSVSAIVKLLGAVIPPQVATVIALIQAGFSALLTALQNYQAGTGVLADIQNAVTSVENAFASFFASLSIPSSLLNTIEGLGDILLSTLEAFAAKIGVTAGVKGVQAHAVAPVWRSTKKYKSDWNAFAVAQGHPEAKI